MTWRRCRIHWWCPKNCDAVRVDDLIAVTDEAIDLLHDVYTAEGNEEWFDRRDALFARAGVARQPKGNQ